MTPLTLKFVAPAQVGCGERDLPLTPSVSVARWMLKQVQHDVGRSIPLRPLRLCVNPLICHSRESGNASTELSAKWFAQRHEGIKKLLPIFVSSCEPKSYRVRKYKTIPPQKNRHPELVCALHACGSRVHFSSPLFGLRGTMDAEPSSA